VIDKLDTLKSIKKYYSANKKTFLRGISIITEISKLCIPNDGNKLKFVS